MTSKGMSIRFRSTQVTPRQRAAGGVKGIGPRKRGQNCCNGRGGRRGVAVDSRPQRYGKLSLMRHYRLQSRGGMGIITLKVTSRTGNVAAATVVSEEVRTDSEGKLFLLTDKAQVLRTNLSEIRSTGRIAQGVKIVVPEEGDHISAIRVVEGQRKAEREIDPRSLDGDLHKNNGEDQVGAELRNGDSEGQPAQVVGVRFGYARY